MDSLDFSRSKILNNIPKKKFEEFIKDIENNNEDKKTKSLKLIALNRYYESNIPIDYWHLKMEKDFVGDPTLLKKYNDYTSDLKSNYINGISFCLAGSHGRGKTLTIACILKKATHKNFSCLYTTLSDIVNSLTQAPNDEKFIARRELTMVDFLAIDEFDSRFMPSDNAADLYARTLEGIFRTRSQNKLPTLMCTNSPNIVEAFNGPLKQSIESLVKGYLEIIPVFGEDFRKKKV